MSQAFVMVLTTFALAQYDSRVFDFGANSNIRYDNTKGEAVNNKRSSKSCQKIYSQMDVTFYSNGNPYPGEALFEADCTCYLICKSGVTYPTEIVFPESLTFEDAEYSVTKLNFAYTGLKEVTFPKTLKIIPQNAFRDCPITKITWGGNEEELNDAFNDARIKEVVLPRSLKYVKGLSSSFRYSSVLVFPEEILEVSGTLTNVIDRKIYFYAKTWRNGKISLAGYPAGNLQFYYFPKTKLIGSLEISGTALTVYTRVDYNEDLIFGAHRPLKVLTDDFRIYYSTTGGIALAETFKQKDLFFTIPGSFSEVADKNVDEIGPELLKDWTELMDITIPKSIKTINMSAFSGCKELLSIRFEEGSELSSVMSEAFAGTPFIDFTFGDNVRTIGSKIFKSCEALESISLPAIMTSIDSNAFSDCTSIKTFTIRNTDTTVNTYSGCESLSGTLVISEGIKTIDASCFTKTSIKTLKLPESLTTINMAAFYTCTSLTGTLKLPSAIQKIDPNAFGSCSSLTEVRYCGVNVISGSVFGTSSSIKSVYVSKNYKGDKFGGISVIKALDDKCEIDEEVEVESSIPSESTPSKEEESSIPSESIPSESSPSEESSASSKPDEGDKDPTEPSKEEKPDDESEANRESTTDGDINANINGNLSVKISVSVVSVVFVVLAIVAIVLLKTPILKKCCKKKDNEVSSDSGDDKDGTTILDKDLNINGKLSLEGNQVNGNNLNFHVNCCAIA